MTQTTALLLRLTFVWLTLLVAGAGGALVAAPGAERDVEFESELYVAREAEVRRSRQGRLASQKDYDPATARASESEQSVAGEESACPARRFPSLRDSEMRIQV